MSLSVCVWWGGGSISLIRIYQGSIQRGSLTGCGRNSCSVAWTEPRCVALVFWMLETERGREGRLGGWDRMSLLYALPESNQSKAKWEPSVRSCCCCCWYFNEVEADVECRCRRWSQKWITQRNAWLNVSQQYVCVCVCVSVCVRGRRAECVRMFNSLVWLIKSTTGKSNRKKECATQKIKEETQRGTWSRYG